jgi:chromosomal replication initiator protein
MDKSSLWKQICTEILDRNIVKEMSFENWFAPVRPLHFVNGVLLLHIDNIFALDTLNRQYRSIILSVGKEIDSSLNEVRFTREGEVPVPVAAKEEVEPPKKEFVPTPTKPYQHPLNVKLNFKSFINADENSFALQSAMAVAENPGEKGYNPLYIYGGVGSGKSHLLHAIGNMVKKSRPNSKIVLTTADEFFYNYSSSLRKGDNMNKRIDSFISTFKTADLLLLDEVHLFSEKYGAQNEIFKIFNLLHQKGKQMVFTADRPPEKLTGVEERLISRFAWGLSVEIRPPRVETKVAILFEMAEREHLDLSEDVVAYIAENGPANVRELEGIIIRLLAHASIHKTDIDMTAAQKALNRPTSDTDQQFRIEDIIKVSAAYYKLDFELIFEKNRTKEVANCRQVAMYIAKKQTKHSLSSIGKEFGGRDHSTVVHAEKTIAEKRENDPDIANDIENILKDLRKL